MNKQDLFLGIALGVSYIVLFISAINNNIENKKTEEQLKDTQMQLQLCEAEFNIYQKLN